MWTIAAGLACRAGAEMARQTNYDGCLVQSNDSPHQVMLFFDDMPKNVRDAVNYSPYKLCTICASQFTRVSQVRDMEDRIRVMLAKREDYQERARKGWINRRKRDDRPAIPTSYAFRRPYSSTSYNR
jgi:hypothetical protein